MTSILDDTTSVQRAWKMVADYAGLAARQAHSAADGDVAAGKKAAETLMFTQRLAAASAGFGAGWSPERILTEVANTITRAQDQEMERHKQMLKHQRDALQVSWDQSEKLRRGVDGVIENLTAVAEFCATLKLEKK